MTIVNIDRQQHKTLKSRILITADGLKHTNFIELYMHLTYCLIVRVPITLVLCLQPNESRTRTRFVELKGDWWNGHSGGLDCAVLVCRVDRVDHECA